MQAKIGKIDKRINSTKNTFSGNLHTLVLKDPVSRENPTLLLTGSPMEDSNYMSFNGAYYWIDDIVSDTHGTFKVSAHIDPLATARDKIKTGTGFINYGPKTKSYNKLVDSRLNPDVLVRLVKSDATFTKFSNVGSVILRVVDFPVNASGVITSGGVQTICGSMLSFQRLLISYCGTLATDVSNLGSDFEKLIGKVAGLGNALDSIKSAVWVPISLDDIKGGAYGGNLGGYPITGGWNFVTPWSGYPITEEVAHSISLSPQTATYPWLLHPNYTKLNVITPGGKLDLSSSSHLFGNVSSINLKIRYGMNIDGDAFLTFIDADNNEVLNATNWNAAINLMDYVFKAKDAVISGIEAGLKIGTSVVSGISGVGGAITSVGEVVNSSGDSVFGSKLSDLGKGMNISNKTLSTGIQGACNSISVPVNSPGFSAPNNLCSYYLVTDTSTTFCTFIMEEYQPKVIFSNHYDDFCNEYGWPVFDYGTLDTNGFYSCAGISIPGNIDSNHISSINSIANSGIIIE